MAANPQTATMLAVLAREGDLPHQRVHLYDRFLKFALTNNGMNGYGGANQVGGHLVALRSRPRTRPAQVASHSRGSRRSERATFSARGCPPPEHSSGPTRSSARQGNRCCMTWSSTRDSCRSGTPTSRTPLGASSPSPTARCRSSSSRVTTPRARKKCWSGERPLLASADRADLCDADRRTKPSTRWSGSSDNSRGSPLPELSGTRTSSNGVNGSRC